MTDEERRLLFETPTKWERRGVLFAIILFLVASWSGLVMCAQSVRAAEPPRQAEEVAETSKCGAPLQMFKGLQLVQLQIDPETLAAQAIYYRKLADGKIILFRLLREGCEVPWKDGGIKVLQGPKCVPSEGTSCL